MCYYLPKKESFTTFNDFRPISLCNFVNKVFTRVLCGRLKTLLPNLISAEQSAFVPGRDISDNILLIQDFLQHLHRRARGHNLIFKLDMLKAFDRVGWDFLRLLMDKFGFHRNYIQLVLNNLQGSWFSVLFNGASVVYGAR